MYFILWSFFYIYHTIKVWLVEELHVYACNSERMVKIGAELP